KAVTGETVPAIAAFGDAPTAEAASATSRASTQRPASATPPRGRGTNPHESAPSPDDAARVDSSPLPADGPWSRVAQALSASDWQGADRSLVELSTSSGDPATRDAAELVRAELRIAHGQGAALRASVERLALHGATPLIRKRATLLLDKIP